MNKYDPAPYRESLHRARKPKVSRVTEAEKRVAAARRKAEQIKEDLELEKLINPY